MAEHCDGIIPNTLKTPELFFNRSWLSFDQILNFHRTGNLHFDAEICALVYKTELGLLLLASNDSSKAILDLIEIVL